MGKKEGKAKKALQRKKRSLVVFGKGVGAVVDAVDTHLSKQGERHDIFTQVEAHGPIWGIPMSAADRMEQSCPMCGSENMWDCKCSDGDEEQVNGCFDDWDELKEATVQVWINQGGGKLKGSMDDQAKEDTSDSESLVFSDSEISSPVRGRMVMPSSSFDSPDSVAAFPSSISNISPPIDTNFSDPPQHGFRGSRRINLSTPTSK
jgi:hypothetical protein